MTRDTHVRADGPPLDPEVLSKRKIQLTLGDADVSTPRGVFNELRLLIRDAATLEVIRVIDLDVTGNHLIVSDPAPSAGEEDVVRFEPVYSGRLDPAGVQTATFAPEPLRPLVSAGTAAVSCPNCGGTDFDGDSPDFEGYSCTQICSCHTCDCRWGVDYLAILHWVLE